MNDLLEIDMAGEEEVTLLELLDRLLDKGIVITGEMIISVADVDLIYIGLKLIVSSVEALKRTCETGIGYV